MVVGLDPELRAGDLYVHSTVPLQMVGPWVAGKQAG